MQKNPYYYETLEDINLFPWCLPILYDTKNKVKIKNPREKCDETTRYRFALVPDITEKCNLAQSTNAMVTFSELVEDGMHDVLMGHNFERNRKLIVYEIVLKNKFVEKV